MGVDIANVVAPAVCPYHIFGRQVVVTEDETREFFAIGQSWVGNFAGVVHFWTTQFEIGGQITPNGRVVDWLLPIDKVDPFVFDGVSQQTKFLKILEGVSSVDVDFVIGCHPLFTVVREHLVVGHSVMR